VRQLELPMTPMKVSGVEVARIEELKSEHGHTLRLDTTVRKRHLVDASFRGRKD
jgi:hypothetical protein